MKYLLSLLLLMVWTCSNLQAQLAAYMYPDANAPFLCGVASGDPTESEVIIWTKIDPDANVTSMDVYWEMAKEDDFTNIVSSGMLSTDASKDWTIHVNVDSLQAHATYFYRFWDISGNYSAIGRTRTAPTGNSVNHVRMAVGSCSSVYSGYFNAYKRISEREDLDVVIHLGDYIYDFVDEDEEVRVPNPYPSVPESLGEWRDRHEYYLYDPDLREARRMHPWIALWDNHDVASDTSYVGSLQAFHEYLPIRLPDANDIEKIYRKLSYGDLMDIYVADILLYRDQDTVSGNDLSILGNTQYAWLTNELQTSTARWKVVANQNMMCGWSVVGFPSWFPLGNGSVLDETTWDGYDVARDRFLNFLSSNSIDNVLVLSGDSHVSIGADLSEDPYDVADYNPFTGAGSVAVEFLPTSVTRGNLDEMGIPSFLMGAVESASETANPNHVYTDYTQHGYGIVDVKMDTLTAEFWYSEILSVRTNESFGGGLRVLNEENRWERNTTNSPTDPKPIPYDTTANPIDTIGTGDTTTTYVYLGEDLIQKYHVYPNPSSGLFQIDYQIETQKTVSFQVIEVGSGKVVLEQNFGSIPSNSTQQHSIDLKNLADGSYILRLYNDEIDVHKTVIKRRE